MYSGIDLINNLNDLSIALNNSVGELAKCGQALADKEAAYKVKLMDESLRLRDSGMAVTLIDKVVYGLCANERRDRDIAEYVYKAQLENVNAIKLRIRILDNQIAREWGRSE